MFKLEHLEKAEEIKLPTFTGSSKKQESSRKTFTYDSLATLKPLTMWISRNWKIIKEMEIPDHLTCLLRNLYAGQEATVITGHGTTDWFQIGKGVHQGYILSPAYLTYMQSTSYRVPGWMTHKLESRLPGQISTTLMCRWHHPYGKKQRGTKEPLDESEKEESEKLA